MELAKRNQATTHRSHEIDITRAKYQVTIYTEDKEKLTERLAELKGDKTSAWQIKTGNNPQYNLFSETEKTKIFGTAKTIAPIKEAQKGLSSQEINEQLTLHIKPLSEQLLGKPNGMSTANNLRFGNRGSLSINVKNGLWNNFETGEKGNTLQLIAAAMGLSDFKDTLSYAKDFLNHSEFKVKSPEPLKIETEKDREKNSSNKKAYAEKLYNASQNIKGTIAERYLRDYRKLTNYTNADLRFIPKISTWHKEEKTTVSALLCIARNNKGELNHVQVIRLDPRTGNKDNASKIEKQTYGAVNGCPIELNINSNSLVTHLTEGVVTGLSILEANPDAKVLATSGKSNFRNVDLSRLTDKVVLCVDNDGDATFKDLIIEKTIDRLEKAGKSVSLILPKNIGEDLNDVLINEGVSGVKKYLETPINARTVLFNEALKGKETNLNKPISTSPNSEISKEITHKEIKQMLSLKSLIDQEKIHFKTFATMEQNKDKFLALSVPIKESIAKPLDQKLLEK